MNIQIDILIDILFNKKIELLNINNIIHNIKRSI
jgi:hypothetical protein